MRRRTAACVVAALVLVTGACGGGDDEGGDGAAPTEEQETTEGSETTGGSGGGDARQEYLDAANAECRAAFDEVEALPQPEEGDGAAVAEQLQAASSIHASMIDAIRGLDGPPEVVAEVEPVLAEMEATLEDVDRLAGLAAAGDQAGYEELGAQIEADTEPINEQLASIGLTVCAED